MFTNLFDLVFPKVCLACESFLLESEPIICTQCRHDLPLTQFHLENENELTKKFYGKINLEFGAAMLSYHKRGIVHELIHNLKYYKHQEIGTFLGNWYAADLNEISNSKKFDCIIPVPLHKKRLKERGFNQIETFGKALSENLKIPYDDTILKKNIHSETQTKKNRTGRTMVNQDVFSVDFTSLHHGKHFLLIDDVVTTGSTLEACGRALLQIPDSKLSIVAIADTYNMGF